MTRPPKVALTAEQETYLRAEHAKGTTYPLIAAAVGMSCASLARRIRRLGLPKRKAVKKPPPERRRPPRPARAVPTPAMIVPPPPRRPRPEGIPLFELAQGECRWPTGDWPHYLFCGEPVAAPGISWCADHLKRAQNQPRRV
jgi:hypothetical protein